MGYRKDGLEQLVHIRLQDTLHTRQRREKQGEREERGERERERRERRKREREGEREREDIWNVRLIFLLVANLDVAPLEVNIK